MPFDGVVSPGEVENVWFDGAVMACGYETRARHLAERFGSRIAHGVACRFPGQRILAYGANEKAFQSLGFQFVDSGDVGFCDAIQESLHGVLAHGSTRRLLVDISSQSRGRLADIIQAIEQLARESDIEVVFGYSLAKYDRNVSVECPNVEIGPVSSRFAGWSVDPEKPLALIVGVGYEEDRALGAVEYLDPSSTWALMPMSRLTGYRTAVQQANELLIQGVRKSHVLNYDVVDANATYAKIVSLVDHTARRGAVILLPGGPKILALISLLIALGRDDVAVWRVSARGEDRALDRKPSGIGVFVRYCFSKRNETPYMTMRDLSPLTP